MSAPNPDYEPKQGETLTVRETFRDASGAVVDVSGAASLTFRLERPDGTFAADDAASFDSVVGDGTGSDGRVAYALSEGQTDVAGFHLGEFVYDSGGGDIQRYPTGESYILVEITPRVGDIARPRPTVAAGQTVTLTADETAASPYVIEGTLVIEGSLAVDPAPTPDVAAGDTTTQTGDATVSAPYVIEGTLVVEGALTTE